MAILITLIPALPFAGFLVLALVGRRLPRPVCSAVGAGSVGLSACLVLMSAAPFAAGGGAAFSVPLWNWISAGGFSSAVSLRVDALTLAFMFVITFVGFLIHLYSSEFMRDDDGYARFFAGMNLFVGSMLTLVMADDLLLLYLGWEGVGLCSYLLIGFWYRDEANGRAARKAFLITRVGDTAMIIALFILAKNFSTLNIQEIALLAGRQWAAGSTLAVVTALLLLGGALGKSAQLPLQTWLPDAMAGPSPVSALIHAATMVTAGVYLIARTHALFDLAPAVLSAVAVIGAVTLIVAGLSALAQEDLKRILAYSTISQIGYMFLALGVGAAPAAVFHFITHAFFKALLFLGAGAVILSLHEEHSVFKMGGLRTKMPATFWTFLAGAASLAALPLVTSGFYSKDLILAHAWNGPWGGHWLWGAGIAGAFITALYSFRMVFLVFFGSLKTAPARLPGARMLAPLMVLAVLSLAAGFIELPGNMGEVRLLTEFLRGVLPGAAAVPASHLTELMLQACASAATLAGLLAAWVLYLRRPGFLGRCGESKVFESVRGFLLSGWGFDRLYDALFVRPYGWISGVNKNDFLDRAFTGIAFAARGLHGALSSTQNGRLSRYALWVALGAALLLLSVIMI